MPKAKFKWEYLSNQPGIIRIYDLYDENNPTMSVTNDMEAVTDEIARILNVNVCSLYFMCFNTDEKWDIVHRQKQDGSEPEVIWVKSDVDSVLEAENFLIQLINRQFISKTNDSKPT